MEYWAIINNVQVGPMLPADIARMGLTPDTMVWCAGMNQWKKAREVAEFAPYFPPAYAPGMAGAPETAATVASPSNYIVWSVISFLMCCQVTGAVALVYSILVEYRSSNRNMEGAENASHLAKIWNIISLCSGFGWLLLGFILGIAKGFINVLF